MKVVITGHRLHKLKNYDRDWIYDSIKNTLEKLQNKYGYIRGYAGMASGVDLWFCEACMENRINYVACIPFDEQADTMDEQSKKYRDDFIGKAVETRKVKNSWMVEECDIGIAVWDCNKGGTHNVVQQLIEKKKDFIWINPVAQKIWTCV